MRTRVEASAKRDVEDERRIGRRLKVLWGFLGFWVVLVTILLIARQLRGELDVRGRTLAELENKPWEGKLGIGLREQDGNSSSERPIEQNPRGPSSASRVRTTATRRGSSVDTEATLRLFDEL